jgi:hypothetical protein
MFNHKKLKAQDTHFSYELLDENKNVLKRLRREPCFAFLTFNTFKYVNEHVNGNVRYIDFHFPNSKTPYEKDFMAKYAEVCTNMGFPFVYEWKKRSHHLTFDIEKFNDKRVLLVSTLTIGRYLYEKALNVIPAVMFDLIAEGYEPIIALQKAHDYDLAKKYHDLANNYGAGNSNHAIRSARETVKDKECYTKEEIEAKISESTYSIERDDYLNLRGFWEKY